MRAMLRSCLSPTFRAAVVAAPASREIRLTIASLREAMRHGGAPVPARF